jgi:hypothetical protein
MSDSSTVNAATEAPKADAQDNKPNEKQVPVAAVAQLRAEKRAANERATEAEAKLASLPQIDMDALAEAAAQLAREAVARELKPVQDEVQKWKSAVAMGLNEPQADLVASVRGRYPGMPEPQVLAIAQMEKPDLFPQKPTWNRAIHGGLPVTGDSATRGNATQNLTELAAKQRRDGDIEGARSTATQEFLNRARAVFNNRPRF